MSMPKSGNGPKRATSTRQATSAHGSAPVPAKPTASVQQNTTTASQTSPSEPRIFDFVIVLCPNIGFGPELEEYAPDGLYIGARARMQAAVDLFHRADITVGKFIVVGGGLEQADHRLRWKKTENMREFLMRHGVPPEDILCVASEPDTSGNFRAIWLTCHKLLQAKTVGVLTNQYHMARALCIATDPQFDWGGARFIPLAAESLLTDNIKLPAHDEAPMAGRLMREQHGLNDWRRGTYRNQHLPSDTWQGALHTPA